MGGHVCLSYLFFLNADFDASYQQKRKRISRSVTKRFSAVPRLLFSDYFFISFFSI